MIARITGRLLELDTTANLIILEAGHLGYEVMVPGYAISDLSRQIGREVTLHCLEYHEATGAAGGNLIPRLVGFNQALEKAFFQRFISVKGIGIRKALRALAQPISTVAHYIEAEDAKMLATLPEIGKRTAQQIIAELKGKVQEYALDTGRATAEHRPLTPIEQEALEILLQLGEKAQEAEDLITLTLENHPDIQTTDALVQAVYRTKAGAR